jgi:hypothetical protein
VRLISTLVLVALVSPPLIFSKCIPFDQARQHVGETRCITGRVVRIEQGMKGAHYLDFCQDYRLCPFTTVIFPNDLKSVGDVRQLQGRVVEIHGPVKEYDGPAEIVLQEARQLGGQGRAFLRFPKITMSRSRDTSARGSSGIRKLGNVMFFVAGRNNHADSRLLRQV